MTDVERVRLLEKDHAPDGFPAVEMGILTRLADRVAELESHISQWEDGFKGLASQARVWAEDLATQNRERDDLRADRDSWYQQCEDARELALRLGKERDALAVKLARSKAFARRFYEMWAATTIDTTTDDFDEKFNREVERVTP